MKILQLPLEHPAFANRYLLIDEATNEAAAVDPAWYEGALKETLGSLDKIRRFVKVFALVNCAEGFDDLEYVMDGFSDTVMDVLEERGYHARTVAGTRNLPNNNIACEFEVIVEAED